jgi:hypothetical protein
MQSAGGLRAFFVINTVPYPVSVARDGAGILNSSFLVHERKEKRNYRKVVCWSVPVSLILFNFVLLVLYIWYHSFLGSKTDGIVCDETIDLSNLSGCLHSPDPTSALSPSAILSLIRPGDTVILRSLTYLLALWSPCEAGLEKTRVLKKKTAQ